MRLPATLVAAILQLALASANVEASAEPFVGTRAESAAEHRCPAKPGSASFVVDAAESQTKQLTLWDVGFSLRQSWLTEQEACPVVGEPVLTAEEVPVKEEHPKKEDTAPQDLPSFEEWKKSQEGEAQPKSEATAALAENNSNVTNTLNASHQEVVAVPAAPKEESKKSSHGRYNYASPDCSARIHSSSRQTQHAAALLHKSKDRYMLTPCKADEHWVVIELCDEIRIESFDLANWEFFSGVVRDVRVSVGGEDGDDWKEVGSFVAHNVRGVQTFHLPQATAFHRFLRLEFPSYYGSEYYCPISQVKVYGMNQMEAFKWEQKQLNLKPSKDTDDAAAEEARSAARAEERKREEERRERELGELESLVQAQARRLEGGLSAFLSSSATPSAQPSTSAEVESSAVASASSSIHHQSASTSASALPIPIAPPADANVTASANATNRKADSSESIYAQIIRRLNAVEGNSTLVRRYIEEQSRVIRLLLGRMERGWDEWKHDWEEEERTRRGQEQMRQEDRLGRILSQLEQQRIAIDHDRKIMENHLRILRDELGHERRRGIAQLLIMVVVIVLGVMTRSSTIDAVLRPLLADVRRRRSMYARRSFSGGPGVASAPPFPTERSESPETDRAVRRPISPGIIRQRRTAAPGFRSISEAFVPPLSPRLKATMTPRPGVALSRRPGRNAHLHPLRTEDANARKGKRSPVTSHISHIHTIPAPQPFDEDWGTDHEQEASSSEVDDDLTHELAKIWQTKPL